MAARGWVIECELRSGLTLVLLEGPGEQWATKAAVLRGLEGPARRLTEAESNALMLGFLGRPGRARSVAGRVDRVRRYSSRPGDEYDYAPHKARRKR